MKKLIVDGNCAACGYCVSECDFFEEKPDGKATPKDIGLITDEQHSEILHIISECSAKAIKVVEDETTKIGGFIGIAELHKFIDENLREFRIEEPIFDDFRYPKEIYRITVTVPKLTSEYKYSDSSFTSAESVAKNAGIEEFSRSIYALKEIMVKELLVFYKLDKLKFFAYLEDDALNYYYSQNQKIRDILKEIEIKAMELTKGNIDLPIDFASFDFGPDKGYDGDTYCYDLRNVENMAYLSSEFPTAECYSPFVKCYQNGDKWCYDLKDVFENFKKSIDFELWYRLPISTQQGWIDKALAPYKKIVREEILKKVATIKNSLKQCGFTNSIDTNKTLNQDLKNLIDTLKNIELKNAYIYAWDIDTDWNSEFRFTSKNECRKAMNNRVDKLYDDCRYFFEHEICQKLGKDYRKQIEGHFIQARKDIQQVYDKYGEKYPSTSIKISPDDNNQDLMQGHIFDIASFGDISISIDRDIETFVKEKILGNKINVYGYLKRADCHIEDCEDIKTGLFGRDVLYTKYAYMMDTNETIDGLLEGCSLICDAAFNDGYIQKRFHRMFSNFIDQFEKGM